MCRPLPYIGHITGPTKTKPVEEGKQGISACCQHMTAMMGKLWITRVAVVALLASCIGLQVA